MQAIYFMETKILEAGVWGLAQYRTPFYSYRNICTLHSSNIGIEK
jgi:hypothetical protein